MIACVRACVRVCVRASGLHGKHFTAALARDTERSLGSGPQNTRCVREALGFPLSPTRSDPHRVRTRYRSVLVIGRLAAGDNTAVQLSCRVHRVHECPRTHPPPPTPTPTALLAGHMNLASCPGQGLCLKSRSVGPQAFHRFNLATHGNCRT